MPPRFLIVGGSGYIGSCLAHRLRARFPDAAIVLADIKPPRDASVGDFVFWDVRTPSPAALDQARWDWIFNFAAVHREPGHTRPEYFDTNVPDAEHVTGLARVTGCNRIFFTSSIAVYGPTHGATRETSARHPTTAYGISKLESEHIHKEWLAEDPARRLIICRPGVIYGPGETGNIPRMVKAIKRGLFLIPGRRDILKSYGYIEGLLDSFLFTTGLDPAAPAWPAADAARRHLTYNYVEAPTEPLGRLAALIALELGKTPRILSVPLWALLPVASLLNTLKGGQTNFHPARVKKAATPTEIIPAKLQEMAFPFHWDFATSLKDWRTKAPQDF